MTHQEMTAWLAAGMRPVRLGFQNEWNRMSLAILREQERVRAYRWCRVAYIVDGVEGWAPWRPIDEYERLTRNAKWLQTDNPGVRAWVERR